MVTLLLKQVLGFALYVKAAGQDSVGVQAKLDGALHCPPDLLQEVPDFRALVELHIFTQRDIAPGTELLDFSKGIFRVYFVLNGRILAVDENIAAADGGHPHFSQLFLTAIGDKIQRVGVGELLRGVVTELHLGMGLAQNLIEHTVGTVTAACLAERFVELHAIAVRIGVSFQKQSGGTLRPHGVGAGRPLADFINVTDRFHLFHLWGHYNSFRGKKQFPFRYFSRMASKESSPASL